MPSAYMDHSTLDLVYVQTYNKRWRFFFVLLPVDSPLFIDTSLDNRDNAAAARMPMKSAEKINWVNQ